MDDPRNIPHEPLEGPREEPQETAMEAAPGQDAESARETARLAGGVAPDWPAAGCAASGVEEASRRRSLRHNLGVLLSLTLAGFALTAWIFVRVDSPFGIFSTGPRDLAQAQLRALDRGQLRPAYEMFSARYRQQVSFDAWHELIATHWRMFHAEVLRAGEPQQSGPGVSLDIHLRGSDEKEYRARFTLVRLAGRWWIDDVHWAEENSEQNNVRT